MMSSATESSTPFNKRLEIVTTIILAVASLLTLSFGALFGGWSLLTRPDGSGLGMPAIWLARRSPTTPSPA